MLLYYFSLRQFQLIKCIFSYTINRLTYIQGLIHELIPNFPIGGCVLHLFFTMLWDGLGSVIEAFPDHTYCFLDGWQLKCKLTV